MTELVWKIDAKMLIDKNGYPQLVEVFNFDDEDLDTEQFDLESTISMGFEQHGITVEFDQDGNVVDMNFDGDTSWDELEILEDIAPFVKQGSYIEMGSFYEFEHTTKIIQAVRWIFQDHEVSSMSYRVTLDEMDNEVSRELIEIDEENN